MARIDDFINRRLQSDTVEEIGIGSFTAFVRMRERYKLTAEVPNTPVEDGSFVSDHIILKPLTLTIEGNVADVHLRSSPLTAGIQRVTAAIGNVTSVYAPARTQAQLSRVAALANDSTDAIRRIDSAIDTGSSVLEFFGNKDTESTTPQQQFIDEMEALHFGQQAFKIEMPYKTHKNMVITSLAIDYDNQTRDTNFSLEAQQIQFAELILDTGETPAPGVNGQTDTQADKGAQEGEEVEASLATQIREAFGL